MKCDIILYSNEAAVGFKYYPKNCKAPILMFKAWAKRCAANNYLSEWQTEALEKLSQKAEYFESNKPATRCCMYKCWEGTYIDDVMKKFFSSLYEKHFFKAGKTLSEEPYSEDTQKDLKKNSKNIAKTKQKKSYLKASSLFKILKKNKVQILP